VNRRALASKAGDIRAAFVYGSVAKKSDHASSDIDLLIVSDVLTHPDVFEALQAVESVLGRRAQPTVMTLADWRKQGMADSFAARIAAGPRLFVIGSDDDLR
jgi:predicted nucleotidyltransferase